MSETETSQFSGLLRPDGPVAIIIRQPLAPVDDDRVIFPPTYPMTTLKGRVYTMRDGDYRVSVELPPGSKRDKNDKTSDQKPGYNIDHFPDGTNSCEIDSPQSQANRIEPMFKASPYRELVPQIEIQVGSDALHNTKVNLLDVGHRAADAVARMSSLADSLHNAFLRIKADDHFALATLAPTSLLFGVWDSRSTYVKVQRIIKAYVRATNVNERTRSAQFTPAADYVAAGAVEEGLDSGEGDKNPLSAEGMKHALATQTAGGVMLTKGSELTRTVNINLAALRQLKGTDDPHKVALQRYVLGLALVAATSDPDLNLREGCNLRLTDEADTIKQVPRRGDPVAITLDLKKVAQFAKAAAEDFFKLAGIDFERKDHLDEVFETGAAEEFLRLSVEDRKRVSQLGPITAATIKQFQEQNRDPFKLVLDLVKKAKQELGARPKKNAPRIKRVEALQPLAEALQATSEASLLPDVKSLADELAGLARRHEDSHEALKTVEAKLRDFKKAQKESRDEQKPDLPSGDGKPLA
jgi:CRISPR-associated protein Csb1